MTRSSARYTLLVLAPAVIVSLAAARRADLADRRRTETSVARVARMAATLLATPAEDDLVRLGRLGRSTGYEVGLLPDSLGARLPPNPSEGSWSGGAVVRVPDQRADGRSVLVRTRDGEASPALPAISAAILALVLVAGFAWARSTASPPGAAEFPEVTRVLLVALPATAALLVALGLGVATDRRDTEALARDLSGVAATARAFSGADARSLAKAAGFDAVSRTADGAMPGTDGSSMADELRALPAPPPSFTGGGELDADGTPLRYASVRLADGSILFVHTPALRTATPFWMAASGLVLASLAAWQLASGRPAPG